MKKIIAICGFLFFLWSCENEAQEKKFDELPETDYREASSKWGFINTDGRLVIPYTYDEIRDFKEGFAVVRKYDEWMYINRAGKVVIKNEFIGAWPFYDGIARVMLKSKKMAFINTEGDILWDKTFDECGDFSYSKAWFKKGNDYGYIDDSGNEMKLNGVVKAYDFKESGVAKVKTANGYGLVDQDGEFVIEPKYDKLNELQNGLILARTEKGYGYLRPNGNWHLKPQWNIAESFKNGKAVAANESGFGLIDKTGEWVLPPEYDIIWYANYDRWVVGKDGKFGAIDKENKWVVDIELDELQSFSDGLAPYRDNELWGYIDTSGRVQLEPRYFLVWAFRNNQARVAEPGVGLVFIDPSGNRKLVGRFGEMHDFYEGLSAVQDLGF